MKISPVGAELFHAGGRADGRTDRHDQGSFSQFCEHVLKGQTRKWLTYESSSHHGPTQLSRYQCTELEVNFGWIYIRHGTARHGTARHGTARHHPNRTHDPRSGSQDHHPSTNSVQKTICCNLASSAPEGGRMRSKHVELRIHQ